MVRSVQDSRIMTAVLTFGFDIEYDCHSPPELTDSTWSDYEGELPQNDILSTSLNTWEASHIGSYSEWVLIWA